MKTTVLKWQAIGAIFIIILGTLWHFIYEWSNNTFLIGLFTPVNESVWEHLKMVLFPSIIFAFIEYKFIKSYANNFIIGITVSIITAMIFIVTMHYTYTFFLDKSIPVIDIIIFIASIILGQYVGYNIMTAKDYPKPISALSFLILFSIVIIFMIFTVFPPELPIFLDSETGKYGMQ